MGIKTSKREGAIIVSPEGGLDVATATQLGERLEKIFKERPDKIIIDLELVDYLASSGLATLVNAVKKANKLRVSFAICGLSKHVRQAIEVTTLDQILPIYKDIDEALRKM